MKTVSFLPHNFQACLSNSFCVRETGFFLQQQQQQQQSLLQ